VSAIAIAIIVFQAEARAGGTTSGTTVSNVARVSWLNNGNPSDTVTPANSADTTVGRVAGDTLLVTADASLSVGETKVYVYEVYNTGNATDTISIEVDSFAMYAGATAWTFTLYVDTPGTRTSTEADTRYLVALAPDAVKTCTVAVWSNSTPANSPDGSFGIFRLKIRAQGSNADTTGQYVGDNGITYGYGQGSNDTSRATISAARLALTKVITSVTMYGSPAMPLPGATILYTLTYNNQGSGAADSVVLKDTIPTNTSFDTASYADSTLGASATFVDGDSGATGWLCQASTSANPDNSFYSTAWENLKTMSYATRSSVTYVRWIRQSVASAQTATLRFRVTIR
jgi:uncharacterized repeat protein (TIGR01451 family)